MMISTKGRYALRVMLDMAEHGGEDNYLRLKDIADRLSLSRKYLETIMTELSKHSLVESAIGKAGGYKLKGPPKDYTAGEILRAAEGEFFPVACLSPDGKKCEGSAACYTMPFWIGLEEHINDYLDHYTLQDLMDSAKNTREGRSCSGEQEEHHEEN